MVDISELEVGDTIKIIDDDNCLRSHYFGASGMGQYAGITTTITKVIHRRDREDYVRISSDNGEWGWFGVFIDCKISDDKQFDIASKDELFAFLTNS